MKKLGSLFRNPYFLSLLSGVFLRMSFPKFDLWFLAWVGFVPLFWAVSRVTLGRALVLSQICGVFFFATTLFWLIHVTVPGMIILGFVLGSYLMFFGAGVRFAALRLSFNQRLIFIPALWVLLEFLRSHLLTGFPWALLGYSQASNLPAIQGADLLGVWGVSFIVVLANVIVWQVCERFAGKKEKHEIALAIAVCCVVAWWGYGFFRLWEDPKKSCSLKATLVQGNIPQEIKWVSSFQEGIVKKYQLLSELADLKKEPDVIIWPETSFPDFLEVGENDKVLKDLSRQLKAPLLVGSIVLKDLRYYNSALFFKEGELRQVYDKIHLVPFGEYIPARKYLPWIERILPIEDFTAGRSYTLFELPGRDCPVIRWGVLVCFEDIFGDISRRFVQRGADVLVNMTNDAWFGDTSSPFQHMQASVFRAVENRVYVVRAANTGITCFIDDTGRLVSVAKDASGKKTFVTETLTDRVYRTGRQSLYTKIGDMFALLCIFCACGLMVLNLRRRR